jgi:hydroxymethylpyrimidine/phosphomethylpyrimidine kinase
MKPLPAILTIAGSDSGGGAGIQADLKTIAMLGGYGLSVVTALTAQNTRGVTGIFAPEPGFVALQLRTVLEDIPVKAAKTGMLFSSGIIRELAEILRGRTFPLVVDPVCVSQSGHRLLQAEAEAALIREMVPLADLLTPNRMEAEVIAGRGVSTEAQAVEAIGRMLDLGAGAVLLKGGHFPAGDQGGAGDAGTITDWLGLSDGKGGEIIPLTRPRVRTADTHGTGCTLSAAIAAGLGHGLPLRRAVEEAQAFLQLGLEHGFTVGGGASPVNHSVPLLRPGAWRTALDSLAGEGSGR